MIAASVNFPSMTSSCLLPLWWGQGNFPRSAGGVDSGFFGITASTLGLKTREIVWAIF